MHLLCLCVAGGPREQPQPGGGWEQSSNSCFMEGYGLEQLWIRWEGNRVEERGFLILILCTRDHWRVRNSEERRRKGAGKVQENNRWEKDAPAGSLCADHAGFAPHRRSMLPSTAWAGTSWDQHLLLPGPWGSSRGFPTQQHQSPTLSQLLAFHSSGLWAFLAMSCTRPCRGSHSFCLYNPGIATSVSKTLPQLSPLTCVLAVEDSWMLCLFFFPSLRISQTAGAVFCQGPASQRGHGIPLSFNCCCLWQIQLSPFLHCVEARQCRILPIPDQSHRSVSSSCCSIWCKAICTFTSQKQEPCYPRAELHCSNVAPNLSLPSTGPGNLKFPWSHTAQEWCNLLCTT